MAWMPLDEVLAGANAVRKYGTLHTADTDTTGDTVTPDAPDAASLPAPSDWLLAASTQPGQQQQELQQQQQGGGEGSNDDVAKMMLAALLNDPADDAESAAAAAGGAGVHDAEGPQQQQQEQQRDRSLVLRKPLAVNKQAIARWLRILAAGRAPAPGLQQQQQQPESLQAQQQQQQQQPDSLQAKQQQQQQAVPVVTELPVDWQRYVQPALPVVPLSAAVDAPTAAGPASSGAADGGAAGEQPWAISIWSGRHARELEEQQQEQQQQEQQQEVAV
jgi:hypothetical protein